MLKKGRKRTAHLSGRPVLKISPEDSEWIQSPPTSADLAWTRRHSVVSRDNFRRTVMIKTFPPTGPNSQQSSGWPDTDRLDSWKEIASYLRREVRTVQLWEKREGLPVHRHFHKRLGSVFALRSEIDRWERQASRKGGDQATESAAPCSPSKGTEDRITIYVLPPKNVTVNT